MYKQYIPKFLKNEGENSPYINSDFSLLDSGIMGDNIFFIPFYNARKIIKILSLYKNPFF